MATKFECQLSEDDADRLFAVKDIEGKKDLTGNEYAKELLSSVLYQKHPKKVQYDDETGEIIK